MSLSKPDRMMVPTAKSTTGTPAPLTDPDRPPHKCCTRSAPRSSMCPAVTITDQFGTITVDIKKPFHPCLPAIKEHEGPLVDPATALMSLQSERVRRRPSARRSSTLNQSRA